MRSARVARGWSQETLAAQFAEAGISVGGQSGVARIEQGIRPTRLNEVMAIARFLGIDIANLDADVSPAAVANIAVDIKRINSEIAELDTALEAAEQAAAAAEHHATQIRNRHAAAVSRSQALQALFATASRAHVDMLKEKVEDDGER